jgi:hypothetical protein
MAGFFGRSDLVEILFGNWLDSSPFGQQQFLGVQGVHVVGPVVIAAVPL